MLLMGCVDTSSDNPSTPDVSIADVAVTDVPIPDTSEPDIPPPDTVSMDTVLECDASVAECDGQERMVCEPGFADCDGLEDNGCEADLSLVENCGSCTNVCQADNGISQCTDGQCIFECESGFANCDALADNGCESVLGTVLHCGACDDVCTADNATAQCTMGQCEYSCLDGHMDCNGDMSDGCETDLTAPSSCGSCDVTCAGACIEGSCETCDEGLALDSNDPSDAARTMGICADLVEAKWVLPDGQKVPTAIDSANFHKGHGILDGFGPNVDAAEGAQLLALSTGAARRPADPDYEPYPGLEKGYESEHPAGFPQEAPKCPGVVTGQPHDGIGLELTLTAPTWAQGFRFDFSFYTQEWPQYICSSYNDIFLAVVTPAVGGQSNGNIAIDSDGGPISVNNTYLEACYCLDPPCISGGMAFECSLGSEVLEGTGFAENASTAWLRAQAPIKGGTPFTIRLAIYDSGDEVLDSTVIVDNFRWLKTGPVVAATPIP